MSYFEFQNAVKLLCGELALERIPNELQHLNAKRPLVLSDAVLAKIGTMAQVPFYSTKKNGSGIGLALAHQIMMVHGGSISVSSQPGVRTTFTLQFVER